ncbi:hypothetical protein AB0F81_33230 [Actinoplanes sp. NPDC024001]|uniref:hypothetical protein n=1 Tax=Actinoplanes sp. NPDC024001 TaxID=3154598 RepID=UPI0033D8424C
MNVVREQRLIEVGLVGEEASLEHRIAEGSASKEGSAGEVALGEDARLVESGSSVQLMTGMES